MRKRFFVNGWAESEKYFLTFGFTAEELQQMESGKIIKKGDNEFWIEIID